jgi:hypothetical protein
VPEVTVPGIIAQEPRQYLGLDLGPRLEPAVQEPHHSRVTVQGQQAVNVIGGELPQHEAIGNQHRLHATDRSPAPAATQPNWLSNVG